MERLGPFIDARGALHGTALCCYTPPPCPSEGREGGGFRPASPAEVFFPDGLGVGLNTSREALRRVGLLLVLAVLGCGRDDRLTPVRGQVFYHGRPLAGGTIVFTPDAERGGRGPLACGEIGADGRYTLHTGD